MKKSTSRFSRTTSAKGFTLMELLVVVAIIVVLAGLTVGGLSAMQRNQAKSKATTQIKLLENALEEYKSEMGRYPERIAGDKTGSNTLYRALFYEGYDYNERKGDSDVAPTVTDGTAMRIYLAELDPTSTKQGWSSTPGGSGDPSKPIGENNTILDPWGFSYNYLPAVDENGNEDIECNNPDFDLWSNGPDGQKGTSDDDNLNNWK
jgi:general secretion pathway protein G